MRVITGTARGRLLKELKGNDTRPTTDQVKEGMFNILQFDIEGRSVLDLFAGTGQLGIEALSRGAEKAVFVEQRNDAVKLIRENVEMCGFADRSRIVTGEALSYLGTVREKFDIIILDPPYESELLDKVIAHIARYDLLAPHGIIMAESAATKTLPALSEPYSIYREYRYGRIKLTVYHREGEQ